MPVTYNEEPKLEYHPPITKVISTIQHKHEVIVLDAAVEKVCTQLYDDFDTSKYLEMPDLRFVVFPIPFVAETTLKLSTTHSMCYNMFGRIKGITITSTDSLKKSGYIMSIEDLDSLRSVSVALPSRAMSNSGLVELWHTNIMPANKILEADVDMSKPFEVKREMFQEYTKIFVAINFIKELDPIATDTFYQVDVHPAIIFLDYKNSAESVLVPVIAGTLSAGITAAGSVVLERLLESHPTFKKICLSLGIPVMVAASTYVGILSYAISEGWCGWDAFNVDTLVQGLTSLQGLASMGVAGVGAILSNVLSSAKASQIAAMIAAGGQAFLLAAAYLSILGTVTQYVYMQDEE